MTCVSVGCRDDESVCAPYAPLRVCVSVIRVCASHFHYDDVEVTLRRRDGTVKRWNDALVSGGDAQCSPACECDDDSLHASTSNDGDGVRHAYWTDRLHRLCLMRDV